MGLPAIYPFEKLPVYHATQTLAYEIGKILSSRKNYRGLDRLDYRGKCLVKIATVISQTICLTNLQTDRDYSLDERRLACDKALEAVNCCRGLIEDFCEREDGDPMHLGRAFELTHEIERGLNANRAALVPGFDPAVYAQQFTVHWPIDDRGRPIATNLRR